MSWLAVAVVGVSVATTAISGISQRNIAKANIQAGEIAKIAQNSANTQAEEEQQRETANLLTQERRRALRERSTAVAQQANTGVAGVSAKRQIDNVLFQSVLNEDSIISRGETDIINIRNSGFAQSSNIQADINRATSSKPSVLAIGLQSAGAGFTTYAGTKSTAVKAGE